MTNQSSPTYVKAALKKGACFHPLVKALVGVGGEGVALRRCELLQLARRSGRPGKEQDRSQREQSEPRHGENGL